MAMAKQLSLEHVVTCGVEKNIAAAMLPQINLWLSSLPARECWQQLTRHIVKPSQPCALHQLLYQDLRNCHMRSRPQHKGLEGAFIKTGELLTCP